MLESIAMFLLLRSPLGFTLLLQTVCPGLCLRHQNCQPGFSSDNFTFTLNTRYLQKGIVLGKVGFSDCNYPDMLFESSHPDFEVGSGREIKVRRSLRVEEELLTFQVYILGLKGRQVGAQVFVTFDLDIANHHEGDKAVKEDMQIDSRQGDASPAFPPRHSAPRRMKRDWVIPPINVAENDRGPYPNRIAQLRSSVNDTRIVYSITGQGADQSPIGRFIIGRHTGWLILTEPLDREEQARYDLLAHAEAVGVGAAEQPMEVVINVIDMNDNKPEFAQDSYLGSVLEAAPIGFEFMAVRATDLDEPGLDSSDILYRIRSQEPSTPSGLFFINPVTGGLQVAAAGLDRETLDQYKLVIEAADNRGNGLMTSCEVTITVEDSNDNAPQFTQTEYTASVPENQMGALVLKMEVTDADEPHSPSWRNRFRIVQGDRAGFFNVTTVHNPQEAILTTAAELDFESGPLFTLLVVVENEVEFSGPVFTSTATVTVRVEDQNEPPFFSPAKRVISVSEDLAVGNDLVRCRATDPDLAMNQSITYKMGSDPAKWLVLDENTGQLQVHNVLDKESSFVTDGTYTAILLAVDNYEVAATGTATLVIELEDVNDNAPSIDQHHLTFCSHQSQPVELSIRDPDGPGFAQPFQSELLGVSQKQWNVHMNHNNTAVLLSMRPQLRVGNYDVVLLIRDNGGIYQNTSIHTKVCDCTGTDIICVERQTGFGMPEIMGILGGFLALLLLLLLLLLFLRKRRPLKKEVLLPEEELVRDGVYVYDEEGGGEEDQDFDPHLLHMDNSRLQTVRTVVPPLSPAPVYRPRPINQEDIAEFIDHNLCAADGDTTTPPYDSLLVFDYEGAGSKVSSLSSLNSSSSEEEQDYQMLTDWGPAFSRLADLYTRGEEDDDVT